MPSPQVDVDNWLVKIGTLEAAVSFAQVINMTWEFLNERANQGDVNARNVLEKGVSWLAIS